MRPLEEHQQGETKSELRSTGEAFRNRYELSECFQEFMHEIESGEVGAMEMVSRDI
jgi:hypothetical protein